MTTNRDDEWFKAFVRKLPGGEVIEDILRIDGQPTIFRNADFFFDGRRIVGELKSLESSRLEKIQAVIDRLRDLGELPIFYHPAPVDEVIKDHPNERKLNLQFLGEIGRTLAHAFREANQQIAQTKDGFHLEGARGVLIVTNRVLPELTPKIAWNEIARLIMKKSGEHFLYPHVESVIYIQDVEVVEIAGNRKFIPGLVLTRDKDQRLTSFSNDFLSAYASAIRIPYFAFEGDPVQILERTSAHERFRAQPNSRGQTRSERWHTQYLSKRIYRQLRDDELAEEVARFTLEEYLVFKNGKIGPNIDKDQIDRLGEKQEHLFTEFEIRNLDMRLVRNKMNNLLDDKSLKGDVACFLTERRDQAAASTSKERSS